MNRPEYCSRAFDNDGTMFDQCFDNIVVQNRVSDPMTDCAFTLYFYHPKIHAPIDMQKKNIYIFGEKISFIKKKYIYIGISWIKNNIS